MACVVSLHLFFNIVEGGEGEEMKEMLVIGLYSTKQHCRRGRTGV